MLTSPPSHATRRGPAPAAPLRPTDRDTDDDHRVASLDMRDIDDGGFGASLDMGGYRRWPPCCLARSRTCRRRQPGRLGRHQLRFARYGGTSTATSRSHRSIWGDIDPGDVVAPLDMTGYRLRRRRRFARYRGISTTATRSPLSMSKMTSALPFTPTECMYVARAR